MTHEVIEIFQELLILIARLMPTYICLQPKYKNKENIAAITVYIWIVMVCLRAVFPISESFYNIFQIVFSALYFLVILVFFKGRTLEKMFLYVSAWLFTTLITSLNLIISRLFIHVIPLSAEMVTFILAVLSVIALYIFVILYFRSRIEQLFESISQRSSTLLLVVPTFFLLIITWGRQSLFSDDTLMSESIAYSVFFLMLCLVILAIYIILINNIFYMIREKQSQAELTFARKLMEQEKQHYNQVLEYSDQIRIIRHDFRHHLHALVNMDKDAQTDYINTLNNEFNSLSEIMYCENQSLNSLLSSYNERAKKENIDYKVILSIPKVLPVDDLTMCIIIGNLLENAFEASLRVKEEFRQVEIKGRYLNDALIMIIENNYDGNIKIKNGKPESIKKNGGLGYISIKKLLTHPGDDFDISYTDDRFVAMIKISDRIIS